MSPYKRRHRHTWSWWIDLRDHIPKTSKLARHAFTSLFLLSGCAKVPLPVEPLTPESIVGTYTLQRVDKNVTMVSGRSRPEGGNFGGVRGTPTVTRDRFSGSFAIPLEALADTLGGTYTLMAYPYGAGGYTYTPQSAGPKGFAGFTYQADTISVFYRANPGLPYTTYVLMFGRGEGG